MLRRCVPKTKGAPIVNVDELLNDLAARIAAQIPAPAASPEPSPWLDAEGAAARIGCGKRRIYDLAGADRIPVHREGARLLFHRDELDEWITSGRAAELS